MGAVIRAAIYKTGSETIQDDIHKSFFDFKIKDIEGNLVNFSIFKDKKAILIVNVACKWGLTSSNYKQLTQLHNELRDKGFELLAFPCNQFMGQEPGNHQEILEFVKDKYHSKFILFEKVDVNGPKAHPLFQYLRNHGPLFDPKTNTAKVIPWNFAKFLVNG